MQPKNGHTDDEPIQLLNKIKELEKLNRQLEAKIKHECNKSRKQEQIMMLQSKWASMGQLVVAIAHQWRQPLTAISFTFQNIKTAFKRGKLDENYLNEAINNAMEQIEYMSGIIDHFANFYKPEKGKQIFDLIAIISETLSFLHDQLLNHSIQVNFTPGSQQPIKLRGFPNEFKQVLINIVNNGIFAIRRKMDKGLLKVNQGEIRIEIIQKNKMVYVKVSNNGEKIPPEIMDRIFEPLYAPKRYGKGMGVGLYMSKVIIENNMGGKIYCRNTKTGVVFIIELIKEQLDE